jgi:hypothetical protein
VAAGRFRLQGPRKCHIVWDAIGTTWDFKSTPRGVLLSELGQLFVSKKCKRYRKITETASAHCCPLILGGCQVHCIYSLVHHCKLYVRLWTTATLCFL